MKLVQLRDIVKRKVRYIQIYQSSTIIEVQDSLIIGNLIGDALIEIPNLEKIGDLNSCQWKFLGDIFRVPREISFSLFGDQESNWELFNNCSQISIDNLRRFWLNEGFVKLEGDDSDLLIQQYNIENYLRLSVKRKEDLYLVTKGILFPTRKELRRHSEESLLRGLK